MSAARVVLSYLDSIRFHINFLTEIINISLAGKEKIIQPRL